MADELRHVISVEPIIIPENGPAGQRTEQPALRQVGLRKRDRILDNAGDDVRVFDRDDPEGFRILMALNQSKGVFEGDVWRDIVAVRYSYPGEPWETRRAAWLALDDAEKFRHHIYQKCPSSIHAAIWVGYRNGQPAHARLLDRSAGIDEVWIQWIVGTKALGRSGLTLFQALWDIGVRRVCWKALPTHPLVDGHWRKFPEMKLGPAERWEAHHPGHYIKGLFEMTERPDKPYEYYRRGQA